MIAFIIIALLTLGSAAVAMTLRNLIHSALLLIGSWAGIAAFYLWAGAEFVAFAQVLIYVGAVSMVVLFAVLLTRHSRVDQAIAPDSLGRVIAALLVGGGVLGILCGAVLSMRPPEVNEDTTTVTVRELGIQMMGPHAASLLIIGAMLTLALLGAVVIAAPERDERKGNRA